jgi:hypothetical protein
MLWQRALATHVFRNLVVSMLLVRSLMMKRARFLQPGSFNVVSALADVEMRWVNARARFM